MYVRTYNLNVNNVLWWRMGMWVGVAGMINDCDTKNGTKIIPKIDFISKNKDFSIRNVYGFNVNPIL